MKLVLLAGPGESTTFVYNAINDHFPINDVIIEDKVSIRRLITLRIKKLGGLKVINQLIFQLTMPKILFFLSKSRLEFLKKQYNLSDKAILTDKVHFVKSVNEEECISILKKINPDVIIVNGTRIISNKVLSSVSSLFINTHVGITPEYRGVHGAYWALVKNDKANCGVTVHKVDKGIDTGDLLRQATIDVGEKDNFVTYPYHQYGVGINLLKEVLDDYENSKLNTFKKDFAESNLYYHPTIFEYLINRLKGVK
jgi:methionyl-tRNA formyltransferase